MELGHLDAEEVRDHVQSRAQAQQQDLASGTPASHRLADELDQHDREGADRGETAGDRQVLARDDVRVEEDEAPDEDLDDDQVAQAT